jgi:hypothetical protein
MKHHWIIVRTIGVAILVLCLLAIWASEGRAEGKETEKAVEEKVKAEVKKEEGPEKPQWTLGLDVFNQYVWRGIGLSRGSAVMQPSLTGSYKGFTANVWGNIDTSEKNPFGLKRPNSRQAHWNETDLTFSYSYEVVKNLTLTGGVIYYILDSNNSQFDSVEIYGGFGYKLPWFEFGFAAYREVAHLPGTYLMWYLSRSFDLPLWGMSLDLWASWSAEFSNDKAAYPIPADDQGNYRNKFYQSLHAGHLMATLNIPLGKYVKFSPKIMYWYALGGDSTYVLAGKGPTPGLSWDRKHNHLLGGASLTVNF